MAYQNTYTPPQTPAQRTVPSTPLPGNANAALEKAILSMQCLHSIYKEENEHLKASDSKAFMDLQDKKYVAAIEYEDIARQMMERTEEIKGASPALKDKIKQMHEEFTSLKTENLEALERMQGSARRLGNTLRKAAIRATEKQCTNNYTETGGMQNKAKQQRVSSGINETA
ncbi:MAG: hypothetical protein ACRBDL_04740 [Alphaproteobacteria bacterium]